MSPIDRGGFAGADDPKEPLTSQARMNRVREEQLENKSVTNPKLADEAVTERTLHADLKTDLQSYAGDYKESARSADHGPWLLCDGRVVLRNDYPDLFGIVGTSFNTGGEDAFSFRLPNRKGRVMVPLDDSQPEFNTLGEVGGTKTHTLTTAEIPSHDHAGAPDVHVHQIEVSAPVATATPDPLGTQRVLEPGSGTFLNTEDDAYTPDVAVTGGGDPHNNLQPYLVAGNVFIHT